MSDPSKAKAQVLVVQFLVPIYDRKGKPYPRSVQKGVRRDLEDRFDGGPSPPTSPSPARGAIPSQARSSTTIRGATRSGSIRPDWPTSTHTLPSSPIDSARKHCGGSPMPEGRGR